MLEVLQAWEAALKLAIEHDAWASLREVSLADDLPITGVVAVLLEVPNDRCSAGYLVHTTGQWDALACTTYLAGGPLPLLDVARAWNDQLYAEVRSGN